MSISEHKYKRDGEHVASTSTAFLYGYIFESYGFAYEVSSTHTMGQFASWSLIKPSGGVIYKGQSPVSKQVKGKTRMA